MSFGFPIIDFHVHLPVSHRRRRETAVATRAPATAGAATAEDAARAARIARAAQRYSQARRQAWRREWGFPDPVDTSGLTDEEIADRWAGEADEHELAHVVLVTGGGNDRLAKLVRRHPGKFIGFAHHDPAAPDAAGEFRRAVEDLGLAGYKVIAPTLALATWDDPSLEPLWTYAEERGLPFLIHFGWLGTGGGIVSHPLISPLSIFNVAHRHPDLPIVVAHFGSGYWGDLLQLCWSCENVYIDTSGSNQWMRWMPYPLSLEDLFRKAYETVGPGRIIFGTDSSWFPRGFAVRYLQDQARACRWIGMKDDDVAAIFGGNAARLLGLAPGAGTAGGR